MSGYGAPKAGEETMRVSQQDQPVPTMAAALIVPDDEIALNEHVVVKVLAAQDKGKKSRWIRYRMIWPNAGHEGERTFLRTTLVGAVHRRGPAKS